MGFGTALNVTAFKTQRQLSVTTGRLNTSYERLSSGLRINRSQDDAAGLAVAEKLRSDSRVATVSMRNANDGISIISIADAAVGEISTILNRLDELAQQSANGSNTNVQRSALQNEFANLMSEVERIAHTTEFNGLNLLSSQGAMTFQVGFNGSSLSGITFSGIAATLGSMGLSQLGSSRLRMPLARLLRLLRGPSRPSAEAGVL
jgi:flagellin